MSTFHRIEQLKYYKCKSAECSRNLYIFQQNCLKVREKIPRVNVKPPEYRLHVLHNAKRLQQEQERREQIARDNFILYKKLMEIMNGKLQRKYPITQKKSSCIKTR